MLCLVPLRAVIKTWFDYRSYDVIVDHISKQSRRLIFRPFVVNEDSPVDIICGQRAWFGFHRSKLHESPSVFRTNPWVSPVKIDQPIRYAFPSSRLRSRNRTNGQERTAANMTW